MPEPPPAPRYRPIHVDKIPAYTRELDTAVDAQLRVTERKDREDVAKMLDAARAGARSAREESGRRAAEVMDAGYQRRIAPYKAAYPTEQTFTLADLVEVQDSSGKGTSMALVVRGQNPDEKHLVMLDKLTANPKSVTKLTDALKAPGGTFNLKIGWYFELDETGCN